MTGARFDLPATSTLIAFEATARLGSVSLAAKELATSQSAISRHLRTCESALGTKLFERRGRGIVITREGEDYYGTVRSALENLREAGDALRTRRTGLTIGCTQEISMLLLLPVFSRLKQALGAGIDLRIMTCDYDGPHPAAPVGADLVFEYAGRSNDADSARILDEEIVPIASPALEERVARVMARHPRHWVGVPRLEIAGQRNRGWAGWRTWFAAHDCDPPEAPVEIFWNYLNLLEAAADGWGIALGWNGFMSGHFETGRLVALRRRWLATKTGLHAVRTPRARGKASAERCVEALAALAPTLTGPPPVSRSARSRPRPAASEPLRAPPGDLAGDVQSGRLHGGLRDGSQHGSQQRRAPSRRLSSPSRTVTRPCGLRVPEAPTPLREHQVGSDRDAAPRVAFGERGERHPLLAALVPPTVDLSG